MHYITEVEYEADHRLLLTFEDGRRRRVDLAPHLDGEVFEPLRDIKRFRTARLNATLTPSCGITEPTCRPTSCMTSANRLTKHWPAKWPREARPMAARAPKRGHAGMRRAKIIDQVIAAQGGWQGGVWERIKL